MRYKYTFMYPYLIEEINKCNNKNYQSLIDYLTYEKSDLSNIPKELFNSKVTYNYSKYEYKW